MLARALWKQRAQTHVHKLLAPTGEAVLYSSKIASLFRDYVELYHLEGGRSLSAGASRSQAISDYLASAGLPSLMPEQKVDLETPIFHLEIETTIKTLPTGKSPGPDG